MNFRSASLFLILIIASFSVNAEQIFAQEKPLEIGYIFSKINDKSAKSVDTINAQLINETLIRKVDFVLDPMSEKLLRNAGAGGLLIGTIFDNASESAKTEILEKLSGAERCFKNGIGYDETLKFIVLMKQAIRVFDKSPELQDQVGYLKLMLPDFEKRLAALEQPENYEKDLERQINENEKLYKIFIDNHRGTTEQKRIALEAAKEYIKKYGHDALFQPQVDYLESAVAKIASLFHQYRTDLKESRYRYFNDSFVKNNIDDLFDAGAQILEHEPEFLDVTLTLASVGFDRFIKDSDRKYLTLSIQYAEKSIDLMEKNTKSRGNYGTFDFSYKSEKYPDGRANALGFMNYFIGYIKYFELNEKEEGLEFFRKSLTYKSSAADKIRKLDFFSIP